TVAKSPVVETLVRLSTSAPVLVSDTSCGGAVVLIVCVPKTSVDGKTAMPDASVVIAFTRTRPMAAAVAFDTVLIVSVDVAPAAPGVTAGGSKTHVVCGGRLPLVQL